MLHYHIALCQRRQLQPFIYPMTGMSGTKNIVLNLHCKSVSSFRGVVLLWLGFSTPFSHCDLASVEQTSLPSHLCKKGNNFMPLTVQGRPWASLSVESLLTQIHNLHAGKFTLFPDTSSHFLATQLQVLAHSNGNHSYLGHCDLLVLYRCFYLATTFSCFLNNLVSFFCRNTCES